MFYVPVPCMVSIDFHKVALDMNKVIEKAICKECVSPSDFPAGLLSDAKHLLEDSLRQIYGTSPRFHPCLSYARAAFTRSISEDDDQPELEELITALSSYLGLLTALSGGLKEGYPVPVWKFNSANLPGWNAMSRFFEEFGSFY